MKVFIVADMEGVSGVVYWPQPQLGGRDARDDERQRRAMAEDLNAVVQGARRGGATDFYVLDFHGASPPRPNLLMTDLDPGIKVYSGPGHFGLMKGLLDASFDALIILGMHAYDGVADGLLSHNFTSTFKEIYVNGLRIGETGYFALLAGFYGVPVALVTGDDAACAEARELLGEVEVVATKQGITHGLALLTPLAEAREALTAGGERAMRRLSRFKPFNLAGPYRVEIVLGGGMETRKADICCMFPWVERLGGDRIAFNTAGLLEALQTLRALHLLAETQRSR